MEFDSGMESDFDLNDFSGFCFTDLFSSSSDLEDEYELDPTIQPAEEVEFDSGMEADDECSDVGDGYEIDWLSSSSDDLISSSSDSEDDFEMDPTIQLQDEVEFDVERSVKYCTELYVVSTMRTADTVRLNSLLGFSVCGVRNVSNLVPCVKRSQTSFIICLLTSLR